MSTSQTVLEIQNISKKYANVQAVDEISFELKSGEIFGLLGPLAVALSFIPFSSPLAMLMRMTAAAVPGWHILVSLILLFFTSIGIVWLMARLFRVQTLLSGESFSLSRFWKVVREG